MTKKVRVRFAPSPTGPLHIGGLRTALFNYLFAKRNGGDFVVRIEDTDRNRYIEGSEKHIMDSLKWCGLTIDEGPENKGSYGPYRQSERKKLYETKIQELLKKGRAYYAFDKKEDLDFHRKDHEKKGKTFMYNAHNRKKLNNSLSLSVEETNKLVNSGAEHVIRFKTPAKQEVICKDELRGVVRVSTETIDDKILFKSDGMPTYHFANVIDDYEMEISHVIRGEEWLPSLPLHWLLYEAFGWDNKPKFVHLPLILKPVGKGKLSKRDGDKSGFPVFAIQWENEGIIKGYKEHGYLPETVINFLSLLGWNPGSEKEIFTLKELVEVFSLENLNKSGARFDPEKNEWFNHSHIQKTGGKQITSRLKKDFIDFISKDDDKRLDKITELIKPRLNSLNDVFKASRFFFENPENYSEKQFKKLKKSNYKEILEGIIIQIDSTKDLNSFKSSLEELVLKNEWNFGKVMGLLRLSLVGELSGPDLFDIVALLGKDVCTFRIKLLLKAFDSTDV